MSPRAEDVAALARLSRSQVSNYFNRPDLVSVEAKRRIRTAIEQLGYVRNEAARQLRAGTNEMLGLVLLDAWAPFFSEVAQAIEEQALHRGWQLQTANSARNEERERQQLDFFEAERVAGLIVVPQGDVLSRMQRLTGQGTSCVLIDPPRDPAVPDLVPSVTVDHRAGGRLAAAHLRERGATRVSFVGDPWTSRASRERLEGLQDGLGGREVRVIQTSDLALGHGTAAAGAILALPVRDRPDAVLVGNDITAIGLVHALLVGGVSVPRDMAVVGYDDIDLAAQVAVPLTTIRQPVDELAAAVTSMAIDRPFDLAGPAAHLVLQPRLVVRASA